MISKRAARVLLPGLLFAAVASLHFAAAWFGGPARNWHRQTSEYYPLLTDAFLAGQTSLLVRPSAELLALPDPYDYVANAELRLHDASLYHGKYYLYFGPVPAIVLFLPFKVLTGWHLPTRFAVAFFSAIGFGCSCALFFLLAKREKWDCPAWLGSAAVLSLGTAPGAFFLLMRPSFYEVAIGAGYCFMMAGFLLTARGLGEGPPRMAPLAGAGLCFGLAAGCRPNFAILAALMVVLVAFRSRSNKTHGLAFVGPVVVCGILLAAYNYARFQNPFEFGNHYQLADADIHGSQFSLATCIPGMYYLLLAPPWISRHYPFIGPSNSLAAFSSLPKDFAVAPTIGLVWVAPQALLALMTPWFWRDRRIRDFVKLGSTAFLIASVYVCALAVTAVFVLLGWIAGRYLVDFAPELLLLSWFLLAALWQGVRGLPGRQRRWLQCAVAGFTLYSALLDCWFCLTKVILGHSL
jgi:hypothetical protein